MGVVSRKWIWVEFMGVASGCGCKEVYIFPIPTSLVSVLFCSSIPTFCSFKKMFFFLVIINYIALEEKCRGGACAQEWYVHC